jgi:hypothetical protein
MRQIAQCIAFCLVFGAPTTCRCQSRVPSPDDARARSVDNSTASPGSSVTMTGILLVDDWRCDEWSADVPKDSMMCPEGGLSQWGLITATKQYIVRGINSELRKYERQRVMATGAVTAATGDVPIDKLEVQLIASNKVDKNPIRELIGELRSNPWTQPVNTSNSTLWDFHFTPPMIQILQAGPAAQDVLLEYISDPQIKDQIVFLLGGVGDGNAIEPIIEAMATPVEAQGGAYARKVNLAANLALTNITVGDVIWHHGGGITIDRCPDDPKTCWSVWWTEHRDTFDISHTPKRRYSNYPDYGIYQNPGAYRSESFIHSREYK